MVRAWRLEAGEYKPWTPDAAGRWQRQELAIAFGIEDDLAAVYGVEGSRQLREGEISEALARKDAELIRKDAELAELRRRLEELERS